MDVDESTSKADSEVKHKKRSKKSEAQAAVNKSDGINGGDDLVLHKYLIADENGGIREDAVLGGQPFNAVESANIDYDFTVLKMQMLKH